MKSETKSRKTCVRGHVYFKSSSCPVCPVCSGEEMNKKYGKGFPKISAPAFRALAGAGIFSVRDLTKFSKLELLELHGFGPKAAGILQTFLKTRGLSFRRK